MADVSSLVVDMGENKTKPWIHVKKYGGFVVILLIFTIIISIVYYKDGFTSADGVVARKDIKQVRSDTQVDKEWNLEQLEKSVSLLNRKL